MYVHRIRKAAGGEGSAEQQVTELIGDGRYRYRHEWQQCDAEGRHESG